MSLIDRLRTHAYLRHVSQFRYVSHFRYAGVCLIIELRYGFNLSFNVVLRTVALRGWEIVFQCLHAGAVLVKLKVCCHFFAKGFDVDECRG